MTSNMPTPQLVINHQDILGTINFNLSLYVHRICHYLDLSFDHIEITFLMPSDSAQMNQQYFDNPVPTDTITLRLSEAPLITGDIYLCPDVIHNNAKDYQSSTDKELKIVLIHSILHLIDYTDDTPESAKVMAEKQHEIYRQLQLNEKT